MENKFKKDNIMKMLIMKTIIRQIIVIAKIACFSNNYYKIQLQMYTKKR